MCTLFLQTVLCVTLSVFILSFLFSLTVYMSSNLTFCCLYALFSLLEILFISLILVLKSLYCCAFLFLILFTGSQGLMKFQVFNFNILIDYGIVSIK